MDYKPNSNRFKEEQKKAATEERKSEKVISGSARTRKNNSRKLTDIFISEDVHSVKSYIFMDVLVPAIKKAISDIFTNGIDMILYGETGRSKSSSGGHKVSYSKYYDDGRRSERTRARSMTKLDYDDILFDTRGDAEVVLRELEADIEQYGLVTVADMYDKAGLTEPYTSNKFGWTSVRTAEVVRVRDGYIIKLPKAMAIG